MAAEIDLGVSQQFEKIFHLSKSSLDPIDVSRWFQEKSSSPPRELCEMKDELNRVKSLLNQMPLGKWHKHTRNQNPAGFVINQVRKKAKPELLTQAWCKFTEILHKFPRLVTPDESSEFFSLHLCEAPGAFVTALNHFIHTNLRSGIKWSWIASTLNPYYEGNTTSSMINDDRFILQSLDHWDFGLDDTGDLLNPLNLRHFIQKHGGKVDLVTADGSIDCQIDPARQETLVLDLHFGEILAALGVLKNGGHFVLKMFTFYEAATISHLYLICSVFEQVSVMKPATSKEGNSEVYLICQDYQGIRPDHLSLLIDNLKSPTSLFDLSELDKDFLSAVEKCAGFFMTLQVGVIERNISSFAQLPAEKSCQMFKLEQKQQVAEKFLSNCNIQPLPSESNEIAPKLSAFVDQCRQTDERVDSGTFLDKLQHKSKDEMLKSNRDKLKKLYPSWAPRCRQVEWINLTSFSKTNYCDSAMIFGANFSRVKSSKFCPSRAIQLYQDSLQSHEQDMDKVPKRAKLDLEQSKPKNLKDLNDDFLTKITELYPEILGIETLVIDNSHANTSLDLLENSAKANMDITDQIAQALSALKRGGHLIIKNWALLTRVQVGLFHLLCQDFEEVGFLRPLHNAHGLFFSEFKGGSSSLQCFSKVKDLLTQHQGSLMSFLPMQKLTQEPLYSMIVAHNMNILRESSLYLIDLINSN